jgi:DNA-binding transcriptional MerR regulator
MNLLKPVKVDDWTGYRYYDEDQALDYVKIKNLQTAGFTIDEIKELLCADDETIYDAFSKKINEQEKLLQRMIEIRQSYQREFTMMKNKIMELHKSIKGSMESYSPAEEFGINSKEYDEIVKNLDSYFDEMLESEDYSRKTRSVPT